MWNLAYFEQYNTFNAQASTGWCHTEVSVVAKTLKVYSHEDEVTNETFNEKLPNVKHAVGLFTWLQPAKKLVKASIVFSSLPIRVRIVFCASPMPI